MSGPLRIEGVPEAQRAFASVAKQATPEALSVAAAEAIIPDVAGFSRRDSGAMAEGWEIVGDGDVAYFMNSQDYWTYQEFGTESIEPMRAIPRAWDANEEAVLAATGEVVIEAGKDAGFEQ